jgi:hypothetical protein
MDEAALVRRLAIEKLEAKAAELRPHRAWTKAVFDPEYGFLAQYARLRPHPAEVPPELAVEIARIAWVSALTSVYPAAPRSRRGSSSWTALQACGSPDRGYGIKTRAARRRRLSSPSERVISRKTDL